MAKGRLKRFENSAQLIRHIHQETGVPKDELWYRYEHTRNRG